MRYKIFSILLFVYLFALMIAQPTAQINMGGGAGSPSTQPVSGTVAITGSVSVTGIATAGPSSITIPADNIITATSNGTTSVDLIAADTDNSIIPLFVSVINADDAAGYNVKICDGACSTDNYILLPAPIAQTSSVAGAVTTPVYMSTTKNTKLAFACTTDCTTDVQVSVTYGLIAR